MFSLYNVINNVILYYVIHNNVQCYILDMIDIESILKIRIATIVRNEKCSKECHLYPKFT